ncbi:transglutaminase family protein [Chromobacterium alkanivorans]|uniref:transglutaminase-like domain-containing protein n=1 Tax=Chromobacterium alkanivorans TaxID=1071719 RepID=UPI0019688192|nr:transglutaminase family protein [Chromobacterium alkanivorans]MBN3006277.1 transglutaminase family protein [Chromobacterium alkanivorans]
MQRYLQETPLLDFSHPAIQQLLDAQSWRTLTPDAQLTAIYNFVRDHIRFGFSERDTTPASKILLDGYGQCNTKAILFMALLRAVGQPCRLHGATIHKSMQSGIMEGEVYQVMPEEIMHTWAEVYFGDNWYQLEGLILDQPYLQALQRKFSEVSGSFSGYGVATPNLQQPDIDWKGGNHTYIQKEKVMQDFGVFDDPDTFFSQHSQQASAETLQRFAASLRHDINSNIAKIRQA